MCCLLPYFARAPCFAAVLAQHDYIIDLQKPYVLSCQPSALQTTFALLFAEEGNSQPLPQQQQPHDAQQCAPCQPMLASPEPPDDNAEVSPESVTAAQVEGSSDPRRSSAHSNAQQEQPRASTKRSSGKRTSSRSKQGSMGPAGYPLTPLSNVPSHLTDSSGTRPTSSALTPGLHEVPPLDLEKSRTSAPCSAFYAKGALGHAVNCASGAIASICDICLTKTQL